ncbi:MAG: hypothetical protein O7G85_14060 [Planctomycetota bacterium]|nr:hypothetical protein [Planctomycetota bacterium]
MASSKDKSIMRNLGEFVGHIIKGVKTNPAKATTKQEVRREVEEEVRGEVILRRTTIEEVEYKSPKVDSDSERDTEN